MAGPRAQVGTRGTFWLQDNSHQDNSHAGPSSLEPCFPSRFPLRQPGTLQTSAAPLQVFPPSRTKGQSATSTSSHSSSHDSVRFLRSAHSDFTHVPDDVLHDDHAQKTPLTSDHAHIGQQKLLVAPYAFAKQPLLTITVGGPDDTLLFISSLDAPSQHGRKGKRKALETEDSLAVLRVSLSPAFQSPSPIVSIGLAPQNPSLPGSHFHEGPWLYILTKTALYFCSVRRQAQLPSHGQGDSRFVLSHICTFLTKRVAQQHKSKGVFHIFDDHHVLHVAWHPQKRTSALIVDEAGCIWTWHLDLSTGGNYQWITRGHAVKQVARLPIDPRSTLIQLSWLDDRAHDQALALTHDAIWTIDLASGQCVSANHLVLSPKYIAQSRFHHMLNLNVSQPLRDHTHTLPLLLALSSLGIHIIDVFCPQRELLFIAHHRPFWDTSLRLSLVDIRLTGGGGVSVLLNSHLDPAGTLYHFDCQTLRSDAGPLQAIRAWQKSPPSELCCFHDDESTGGDVIIHSWDRCLPEVESWRQWMASSPRHGSLACFSRSLTGQVIMTTLDRTRTQDVLPIRVALSPALQEITALMKAEAGRTWHPRMPKQVLSSTATPFSLASVFAALLDLTRQRFDSVGVSLLQRQTKVMDSLRHDESLLDSLETSFVTAMDLVAHASTQLAAKVPQMAPFTSPRGAFSACYPPHSLELEYRGAHLQQLMPLLISALGTLRQQGYWDGGRWQGSGHDAGTKVLQPDEDAGAITDGLESAVDTMVSQYLGSEPDALQARHMRTSALRLLVHYSLSQDVWSSRLVEIDQSAELTSADVHEQLGSQVSGLDQPGPWNSTASQDQMRAVPDRRRRQDSVVSNAFEGTPSSKRKRDQKDSDPFLWSQASQSEGMQPESQVSDADAGQGDDVDEEILARQKVPEPPPVHFAYFRHRGHQDAGTDIATPAARQLLSSWPLTSLDPTDAENDPSHYTFADPYALLDTAKGSNEDGYASSVSARSTDTGWSSAWSATSASGISDSERSQTRDRTRSQSVWSSSQQPQSQRRDTAGAGSDFDSQPEPISSSRVQAPPSIAPRLPWDRDRFPATQDGNFDASPSMFFPHSQGPLAGNFGFGASQSQSQFSQMDAAAASQPVPGNHASRKAAAKAAKKAKKRLGGF